MYLRNVITKSTRSYLEDIELLKKKIEYSDYIVIGAGAGLSTAAGFTYSGVDCQPFFEQFL